jgi:hypothetical protein
MVVYTHFLTKGLGFLVSRAWAYMHAHVIACHAILFNTWNRVVIDNCKEKREGKLLSHWLPFPFFRYVN